MKKYKVLITETLSEVVEVEAEDIDSAILKVERQYYNQEIIIYPESFVEATFEDNRDYEEN